MNIVLNRKHDVKSNGCRWDWLRRLLHSHNGLNRTTRLKINHISKRISNGSCVYTPYSRIWNTSYGNMQNGRLFFARNLFKVKARCVHRKRLIRSECVPVCTFSLSLWVQRTDGSSYGPPFPVCATISVIFHFPNQLGNVLSKYTR